MTNNNHNGKSLESWIWDAACSIRGAKDAPKYKDYILPLIFTKRLCDVFDDELNRIAKEVGSRAKAFKLVKHDKKLVRFYLPLEPKNPTNRSGRSSASSSDKIGEQTHDPSARHRRRKPAAQGHHRPRRLQRHHPRPARPRRRPLSATSSRRSARSASAWPTSRPDIIGRSYEYLIRKFAEGSGQSAGEFYTPAEVGLVMARIMDPEPGMEVYDPCCGSAGLLIKCELALEEKMSLRSKKQLCAAQALRPGIRRPRPGPWPT